MCIKIHNIILLACDPTTARHSYHSHHHHHPFPPFPFSRKKCVSSAFFLSLSASSNRQKSRQGRKKKISSPPPYSCCLCIAYFSPNKLYISLCRKQKLVSIILDVFKKVLRKPTSTVAWVLFMLIAKLVASVKKFASSFPSVSLYVSGYNCTTSVYICII